MAFGGRELRLFLSIQSYGSTNIAKLRRDIAGLQTAAEAANARQLAQARLAQRTLRVTAAERELRDVRAGIPFYNARNKAMQTWSRANAGVLRTQTAQLKNTRALWDLETKRMALNQKLSQARATAYTKPGAKGQIQLIERDIQSLAMQEAVLQADSKALNATLVAQRDVVLQADAAYKQLVRDTGAQSAASKAAAANLELQTAAMRQAAVAASQAAAAERMLPLERLEQTGRRIAHIGRTMQFAGLIISAGLSLAATSAANFSQKLYLAATQARDLDAPVSQTLTRVRQLEHGFDQGGVHIEGILDLMQQFPYSADDMATAAYDIYSSMNVSFGGGLRLLKSFNQVALATGGDLTTATNAGITVLNNFGKTSGSIDKILNLMISTIRFGRMHLEEFNAMLEKVAPAAAGAGQSFRDVAGAMALLTTRQPSQRVSATNIARLLQTFQDPDFQKGVYKISDGLVDITKGEGAVGVLKPLPQIIEDMAKSFGLYRKHGGPQQLFKDLTAFGRGRGIGRQSRIEAWRGYTFLVQNLEDYKDLQFKTTHDTTEFAKALATMAKAPGVRWQIFLNQMRAFIIVIGEEALPALLWFAGGISKIVKSFQNMNPVLRQMIVYFTVFVGVGSLVLGTLTNIGGSVVALIANWRIMNALKLNELRMQAALAGQDIAMVTAQTSRLMTTLKLLTGIGIMAIPVAIQLMRGGEPGLWGLLSAAGFGALGGAMIAGAPGAAVGALALPVIVQLISTVQGGDDPVTAAFKDYLYKMEKKKGFLRRGIARFVEGLEPVARLGGITLDVDKESEQFKRWLRQHPKYLKMWRQQQKAHNKDSETMQEEALRLQKEANEKTIREVLGLQDKLSTAAQKQDQIQSEAYDKAAQRVRDAAQIAQVRADAIADAHEDMTGRIKSAVDNLMGIYDKFEQANREAMGSLGQGPVLSGMMGDTFREINDMMRQFGVQIPIPFKLIQKDFDTQMAYFKRWRNDLAKLSKKGVPLEFIQEIQAMGPEAGIPFIEGLLGASDEEFNGFVKKWKSMQKDITAATKTDMKNQLDDWMKHGQNIAWQIVKGIISEPAQAALRKGFRRYVVGTFGDVMQKHMAVTIANAVAKALADLATNKKVEAAAKAAGEAAAAKAAAEATGGKPKTQGQGRRVNPYMGMNFAQLNRTIANIDKQQANIHRQITAYGKAHPGTPPFARVTPAQKRQLAKLQSQENAANKAKQAWLNKERKSVREQLARQAYMGPIQTGKHAGQYKFTYEGDTVYINADGATVAAVMRALNKRKFDRQQRNKPKTGQRRGK